MIILTPPIPDAVPIKQLEEVLEGEWFLRGNCNTMPEVLQRHKLGTVALQEGQEMDTHSSFYEVNGYVFLLMQEEGSICVYATAPLFEDFSINHQVIVNDDEETYEVCLCYDTVDKAYEVVVSHTWRNSSWTRSYSSKEEAAKVFDKLVKKLSKCSHVSRFMSKLKWEFTD